LAAFGGRRIIFSSNPPNRKSAFFSPHTLWSWFSSHPRLMRHPFACLNQRRKPKSWPEKSVPGLFSPWKNGWRGGFNIGWIFESTWEVFWKNATKPDNSNRFPGQRNFEVELGYFFSCWNLSLTFLIGCWVSSSDMQFVRAWNLFHGSGMPWVPLVLRILGIDGVTRGCQFDAESKRPVKIADSSSCPFPTGSVRSTQKCENSDMVFLKPKSLALLMSTFFCQWKPFTLFCIQCFRNCRHGRRRTPPNVL